MDNLYEQYEKLTEEEKNSLLIYKTGLGLLLNDLDNEPDYQFYYDKYTKLLSLPVNMLIKMTVFNTIDFTSLDTFKESIHHIKEILDEATSKITTNEDLVVYRAISSDKDINGLSKGNLISTSLSFGTTLNYSVAGKNIKLYEIHLPAGSKVAVVPYSIELYMQSGRLVLTNSKLDDEIILNNDNYTFEQIDSNNGEIEIITVDAHKKDNIKNK